MSITVTHNDVLASYNELFTSYKDMFTSYSQYIVFFRLNTTAAFHTCTRLHLFVLSIIVQFNHGTDSKLHPHPHSLTTLIILTKIILKGFE